MGEIGLQRKEYLYELTYLDIILIQRGYDRRHRQGWGMTRWQTYYLMSAQVGTKGLRDAGINSPTGLLLFPWEKDPLPAITDDEVADLQQMMATMNAQNSQNGM